MRLIARRLLLYVSTAVLIVFLIIKYHDGNNEAKILDSNCQVSAEVRDNLNNLMIETHKLLDKLKLTHFICYGTLWGILKIDGLLPWEDNIEFCALNEELSEFEEASLIRVFLKNNLVLHYDSQDGVYNVYRPEQRSKGLLRIVVFEKDIDLDMMKRVGWSRRLLPQDCDISPSLQCFPPRLIEPPFPFTNVHGVEYNIPREQIEIQKYLYPDTWWKDIKPSEC